MYYGKLLNTIEKLEERYVKILEDVCNIESPTNLKKGVDAVGKYFLNMAVEERDFPAEYCRKRYMHYTESRCGFAPSKRIRAY